MKNRRGRLVYVECVELVLIWLTDSGHKCKICIRRGRRDFVKMAAKEEKDFAFFCFLFVFICMDKNSCCARRREHIHPWIFLCSGGGPMTLHIDVAIATDEDESCTGDSWAHGCHIGAQKMPTLTENWEDTGCWRCAIFALSSDSGPNCSKKVRKK